MYNLLIISQSFAFISNLLAFLVTERGLFLAASGCFLLSLIITVVCSDEPKHDRRVDDGEERKHYTRPIRYGTKYIKIICQ